MLRLIYILSLLFNLSERAQAQDDALRSIAKMMALGSSFRIGDELSGKDLLTLNGRFSHQLEVDCREQGLTFASRVAKNECLDSTSTLILLLISWCSFQRHTHLGWYHR